VSKNQTKGIMIFSYSSVAVKWFTYKFNIITAHAPPTIMWTSYTFTHVCVY